MNVTLADSKIVELMEIKVVKGCGKKENFNSTDADVIGTYDSSRKCWTTNYTRKIFHWLIKGNY